MKQVRLQAKLQSKAYAKATQPSRRRRGLVMEAYRSIVTLQPSDDAVRKLEELGEKAKRAKGASFLDRYKIEAV